ncbi:hypothetical protein [Candidatus Electronema sp. JM]|uniref:hypothetical protein n=1 Tax=Candidatus Electronema sp. JM TaxID=3401571 RepID=UPI003AA7BB62
MRICAKDAISTLRIEDALSGSTLEIHYRLPTTEERQAVVNEQLRKEGGEVINDFIASRIKYGLRITTGFRAGDFGRMEDGKAVPMASDPRHEHYYADWKDALAEGAGDVLLRLASHVFDSSVSLAKREVEEKN